MGRMKLSVPLYFFLFVLLLLIFFHTRGVIVHDEGYVLNSAQKILSGETIYKDFHFSYTPGSVFLVSLFFSIFGHSVLASRLLMILVSLISAILIFLIAKQITKRDVYGYVCVSMYLAWGPTHINFAWPVMFVIPVSMLTIYILSKNATKTISWVPFAAGFLSFLVFLFKQNFGIIFIAVLFALITSKGFKKNHILYAIYGLLWGVILFGIYLLLTNSVGAFISDFYEFTIRKVLLNNDITTPLFYNDTPIKVASRSLLYFSPLYLSAIATLLLLYRKRYYLLFIPLTVALFLFVGIRPTTDYVHVIPILSLCGIPLIIIANQFPTTLNKLTIYSLFILLIVVGFHSALFRGYYRWDRILAENNQYIGGRLKVFTNPQFSSAQYALQDLIDKHTKKDDYIFINSYSPLLYFTLQRKNPTAYDFPGFIPSKMYEETVIYNLIAKDVKVVLLTSPKDTSPIGTYVRTHYLLHSQIGDFFVYTKT